MKNKKLLIILTAVFSVFLGFFYLFSNTKYGSGIISPNRSTTFIGTSSSPVTLTEDYDNSSSTAIIAKGLNNVALGFTYTPKSHGSSLLLLLERSMDNGNTYLPYVTISPSTDQTYVYPYGTTSTEGIPFVIPGTGTSASGTAITGSFDLTMAADYIRVLAKESTTSTYGTAFVQMLLNN